MNLIFVHVVRYALHERKWLTSVFGVWVMSEYAEIFWLRHFGVLYSFNGWLFLFVGRGENNGLYFGWVVYNQGRNV